MLGAEKISLLIFYLLGVLREIGICARMEDSREGLAPSLLCYKSLIP
jgi:hypothetical protein